MMIHGTISFKIYIHKSIKKLINEQIYNFFKRR